MQSTQFSTVDDAVFSFLLVRTVFFVFSFLVCTYLEGYYYLAFFFSNCIFLADYCLFVSGFFF